MVATIKKSLEQKIDDLQIRIDLLKAKKTNQGLGKDSDGMEKLLAEVENVCKLNNCKTIDVIRSISRIKKTGAKIIKNVKTGKAKVAKVTVPKN